MSSQHQELLERAARGLRAAAEFINKLPLIDGASERAKHREHVTVTLIPDGLLALDSLVEQKEALESSYVEAFELLNWLDQEEKLSSQARAHLRTFWATRNATLDDLSPARDPLCLCGHHASSHPPVWSIAGDATTACRVSDCGCRDYDGETGVA